MRGVWYVTGGGPPAGVTAVIIAVLVFHKTIMEAVQIVAVTMIVLIAVTVAAVITMAVVRYRRGPRTTGDAMQWQPALAQVHDRPAADLPRSAPEPRALAAPAAAPQVHIHLDHVDAAMVAALLGADRNRGPAALGGTTASDAPRRYRSGGAHSRADRPQAPPNRDHPRVNHDTRSRVTMPRTTHTERGINACTERQ